MATTGPAGPDSPITVKISIEGANKKFKIPLRELGPLYVNDKLRQLLDIPSGVPVVFERFSDSAGAYIALDVANPNSFKSLLRAAKAKHKLRLRTVFPDENNKPKVAPFKAMTSQPFMMDLPDLAKTIAANGSQHTLVNLPAFTKPAVPANKPLASSKSFLEQLETSKVPESFASFCARNGAGPSLSRNDRPPTSSEFYRHLNRFHQQRGLFDHPEEINFQRSPYVGPVHPISEPQIPIPASWSVFCNACDLPMDNEHYHCNICDEGDYDLCQACVGAGIHCHNGTHWLIKRTIQNGRVVSSQTSKIAPKTAAQRDVKVEVDSPVTARMPEMPGAFKDDKKAEIVDHIHHDEPSRTCNSCIDVLPDSRFVTCTDCEDYDLCIPCHEKNDHGHHPAHTFEPVSKGTDMSPIGTFLCAPGRNVRHAAICDGCDKPIFGVRHKCLNCPDWDYCTECHKNVKFIHPNHRFVPIYEPLAEPRNSQVHHFGIYCDGPLCKDKHQYISGVRYKCATCDDTDFCASCEANPGNRHNRTHPLIMFKTPIRNVSITTYEDDHAGGPMRTMGDRSRCNPVVNNHSASQVQTIVDLKPSEAPASPSKIEIKDLLAEPIEEKIKVEDVLKPATAAKVVPVTEMNAHFVHDTVTDGSIMVPNQVFTQTWTLTNPGPHAWPTDCSVRFVGGDNMLNVDDTNPSKVSDVAAATESNVTAHSVQVGDTISFSVTMKAPKREGTAISYWRLKSSCGHPFGHRLWCHIKVVAPPPTFSGLQTANREALAAAPSNDLTNMLKGIQARALAANVGQQAAKYVAEMKNVLPLDDIKDHQIMLRDQNRELREKLLQLTKQLANTAMLGMEAPKAADACAELPVERSAVELDQSVEAEAKIEPISKAKSKIIVIPITDGKAKAKTQQVPAPSVEDAEGDDQSAASSSTMIFPKLDKESPASSVHQDEAKAAELQQPQPIVSAITSPASVHARPEIFDDAESVDMFDSSDDEAFMTDEEYDLLDASDEEELA